MYETKIEILIWKSFKLIYFWNTFQKLLLTLETKKHKTLQKKINNQKTKIFKIRAGFLYDWLDCWYPVPLKSSLNSNVNSLIKRKRTDSSTLWVSLFNYLFQRKIKRHVFDSDMKRAQFRNTLSVYFKKLAASSSMCRINIPSNLVMLKTWK